MALLELADVSVHYGRIGALSGISLTVDAGEIVSLIGANGAGKTTTMRAISGIRPLSAGRISFDGEDITRLRADLRVVRGICQAPEGRGVFPGMTVMENLDMGAYARKDRKRLTSDYERVFELFPRLAERRGNGGHQLSGGEQQMLTIGRALMTNPDMILIDEATEGLAPLVAQDIWRTLGVIRGEGIATIVVDKDFRSLSKIADRMVMLSKGTVVFDGAPATLAAQPELLERHLGV